MKNDFLDVLNEVCMDNCMVIKSSYDYAYGLGTVEVFDDVKQLKPNYSVKSDCLNYAAECILISMSINGEI